MTPLPRPRGRKTGPEARTGDATGVSSVSADSDGVAAGRDIRGSALGDHSHVTYVDKQYVTADGTEVRWPVVVGQVPVLASAFQPRAGLRRAVDAARGRGRSVVLTGDDSARDRPAGGAQTPVQVMSGGGGVGKSQLAASYAREALRDGTDLVLWASAADLQQLLTAYARAALLVRAPGCSGSDVEADARAFTGWLATTDRRWLVVLDDITSPDTVEGWWPDSARGSGWVLATTRLKDPRLTGGGRTRVDVHVYTPAEATDYLTGRLTGDGRPHLLDDRAAALAEALGYLPLALGHAAAYMLREQVPCGSYLERFTDRAGRLDEMLPRWADTERYGRQITTTLLLALDATDHDPLGPLARAVLGIAAVLAPDGHPAALWDTQALATHLAHHRTPSRRRPWRRRKAVPPRVTGDEARAALRLLDRYGLLTYDPSADESRAVRIHALTARAVRETGTAADGTETEQRAAATAAADALTEIWPDTDQTQPQLAGILRANSEALTACAYDALWTTTYHPVLACTGESLLNAHLHGAASTFWHTMVTECRHRLGTDHPATLIARGNLASSYRQAGRTGEAIEIEERVLADRERLLGTDHPATLITANTLALWQSASGDPDSQREGSDINP